MTGGRAKTSAGPRARMMALTRQGCECFYCGELLSGKFVMDHLVPRVKGGDNGNHNRVAACRRCDLEKGDRMPTKEEMDKQTDLLSSSERSELGWSFDRRRLRTPALADAWPTGEVV